MAKVANTQIAIWLEPKAASLKRAINAEKNPLIKEIMQKELADVTQAIMELNANSK